MIRSRIVDIFMKVGIGTGPGEQKKKRKQKRAGGESTSR